MEIHFVVILSLLLVATAPISLMMRLINEKQISKGGGDLYNIQLLDGYFLDKPNSSDETRIGHRIEQTSEVPSGKLFNERWQRY